MLRLRHLARQRVLPKARSYATKNNQGSPSNEKIKDHGDDFRPPWVFTASHFLTYTTIPIALLYCVFLADWGDRDHVFMPVRRWALQYKQSFFTLSPEELALVQRSGSAQQNSPGQAEGPTTNS